MKKVLPLLLLPALAACSGTRPARFGESKYGFAAVLVRGRIITPTGEMTDGRLAMNLEGDAERYRLNFEPGETTILRVEPDLYRLHPTRNIFGIIRRNLKLRLAGRTFYVPFPRSVLRMPAVDLKPTRVHPIGILEATLLPIKRGRRPKIILRLDDSAKARRFLLEDAIDKMMDPDTPVTIRSAAVSWTRAIERSLIDIQGEETGGHGFKPSR